MLSIAYLCGTKGYKSFCPTDKGLGGSETAVIELTRRWARAGNKVSVFALTTPATYEGVVWRDVATYNSEQSYDIVILWRQAGFNLLTEHPDLKRGLLVMDFHDGGFDTATFSNNPLSKTIDRLFVKSQFHRSLFTAIPDDSRFAIIPNGIIMEVFNAIRDVKRQPHRFNYSSQYTRGLEPFLRYAWPRIIDAWPDAELHVYYGQAGEPAALARINQLMRQPGVHDHGKVDLAVVAMEKFLSTFHVYLCTAPEIDCISVRESAMAGCIPILTNNYVFRERYGIKIDGDPNNEATQIAAVDRILSLSYSEIALLRREGLKSPTIIDWDEIAARWLKTSKIELGRPPSP